MHIENRFFGMGKKASWVLAASALIAGAGFGVGCATTGRTPAAADGASFDPGASSDANDSSAQRAAGTPTPFQAALTRLGYGVYTANLHAHHYVGPVDRIAPGPCAVGGSFAQDDGRPCRNDAEGRNSFVVPPARRDGTIDPLDYFRLACQYAKEKGGLDILYITAHSKNGAADADTSTLPEEFEARHRLLSEMNRLYDGKFLCGLGQEASSISKGNHINIFGQFPAERSGAPFLFSAGDFPTLYAEMKTRREAGEKVFLQFNHPDARNDLWWGPVAEMSARRRKESLNDYGLDDYAPVACLLKGPTFPGCEGQTATEISPDLLKATFRKIREASADPFRLIEVAATGGATDNPSTDFRRVHSRVDAAGVPTAEAAKIDDGLLDYLFYLAMGFRVAPTANQDNHHMNYGSATASRTGLLATKLTEDAVIDAIDSRRAFATEDRNARLVFFAETAPKATPMGGEVRTAAATQKITIGYADPDAADAGAKVRFYYYRESDALDFNFRAEPSNLIRTVAFGAAGAPSLPRGPVGANAVARVDTIAITNGKTITVNLPVEAGMQYVFAEIIQNGDLDKLWSAPIWIRKTAAAATPAPATPPRR